MVYKGNHPQMALIQVGEICNLPRYIYCIPTHILFLLGFGTEKMVSRPKSTGAKVFVNSSAQSAIPGP